jgi:mannose-6-phosphate isomerase
MNLVRDENWNQLLNSVNVHKHDLFYVPSGTLHALKKGLVILEIQQASDTTFRLYDYNRDQTQRPLTVDKSLENISVPFTKPITKQNEGELLTTPFFSIKEIKNTDIHLYDLSYAR